MKKALLTLLFLGLTVYAWPYNPLEYETIDNDYTGNHFDYVNKLSSTSAGRLMDISTSPANNNDVLTYISADGKFEPKAPTGGGGGGGSSSLEVIAGGVQISSPTGTIIFTGPFKGFSPAASTSTIQIDSITANGVLIISSATSVYLSKLDAASLYATLSQLQSTSTDITSFKLAVQVSTSNNFSASQATGAALSAFIANVAIDSAAKYTELKATAAKESSDFGTLSKSTSDLFGFQTASAAKETNDMLAVRASTNSLLTISSAATTYPPLSGGLVPNTYIDVSSITKVGPLIAGTNITLSIGAGGTTINGSASGGGGDNLGTHIATKTLDMQSNQIINLASTTLNGPASSFTLRSTSSVNPILLFVGQSSFTVTTTTVRIGAPSGFFSNLFAVSTGTVNVFEVNGSSIEANVPFFEATVAITIPDYVFAKDYQMKTLPELFEYVDFYHHLPHLDADKDSAELKKGSLSALFQQTMKLQQSLEEAYIYILQQDKRIRALERKCSKLK